MDFLNLSNGAKPLGDSMSEIKMTREEIEQKMGELARKYVETHDPEIIKEFINWAASLRRRKKNEVIFPRFRESPSSQPFQSAGCCYRVGFGPASCL
jgi:hypothetical protein